MTTRHYIWSFLSAQHLGLEKLRMIIIALLFEWFTDSQTPARVIEAGSMKLDLHRLASEISQFCAEHSILLEVQWVPRTENEKADYISRLQVDFDDWQITQDFFLSLGELWDPQAVDCFVIYYTIKLHSFSFLETRVTQELTSLHKI